MHISLIYLHLICVFISIHFCIDTNTVLFTWQFPYKGPEMCQVFHYVSVLLPANRCITDRGFEYWYICPFWGTLECAVILDNLIQIFLSKTQIRLKNQISQRSVITIRRSGISKIISDLLSKVRKMDPRCICVFVYMYVYMYIYTAVQ